MNYLKKIIKLSLLLLIFFKGYDCLAVEECTTEELSRIKELANNMVFDTELVIGNEIEDANIVEYWYNINILNFDQDLKINYSADVEDYIKGQDVKAGFAGLKDLAGDQTVTFEIYAYTPNLCINRFLRRVSVKLPEYNAYYHFNQEKCAEYPDFEYCQKDKTFDLTFETMDESFEEYIKKQEKTSSVTNKDEKKYTLYIIIGASSLVLIGGLLGIFRVIRKRKKRIELEEGI